MRNTTAALAQSITWASSKQAYYTARLMVDKELVNDYYRAYAYFRWADDMVDLPALNDASSQASDERITFIKRQRELIDRLYQGERPDDLAPEEELIADLISHDKQENSGLQSFIYNLLAIIEFDARRKGRLISQRELIWYSNTLGKSVTDGLQYFIGYSHPYPAANNRYLAATAAHMTHMLRDMVLDIPEGFINIPHEYLIASGVSPEEIDSPPFQAWVREQVNLAWQYFREGKRYLDQLDVLRCKMAGYWYCARFEAVLDTIARDGYRLRPAYNERRKLTTWLKIAWLGLSVPLRHIVHRGQNAAWRDYLNKTRARKGPA